MNICVIPARGGSKRIKKKNIKNFQGKPIIYYPIKEALKSNIFDEIIVSTDDNEIEEIALKYGAKVPFKRPSEISGDMSNTLEVILHSIQFKELKNQIDFVCCLYPTAVFIKSFDLQKAFDLSKKQSSNIVLCAVEYSHPIERSFTLDQNGFTKLRFKNFANSRTQDLKQTFHDAGQFYFGSSLTWKNTENIINNALPYKIPSWRVIDIDTIDDWERAELIYKLLKKMQK